jgi:PAS domain S-box-containing protein
MEAGQTDYRAIFETLSEAILIHDARTGEILDVNRKMCAMFGYTPQEARQLRVMSLWGCETATHQGSARQLLEKAAAGNLQVFEDQLRDRAGRCFWVEIHLNPVKLDGRDCIVAELRDIDARQQAAEALKESEARYRMVTEGSLAGVYVVQDDSFVYVNPTFAQTFGYRVEEILDKTLKPLDLVHPEDLPQVQDSVRRRLSGELDAAHYTFRGRHKDGSVIYCESFGRAVEYQGRPAIVGTLLDITERQRTFDALRQSKIHYQALFEDSPVALWQEDHSDLKTYLESLKKAGIQDFRAYFKDHPEALQHCASLVKIIDVNSATLEIYEAERKEQILDSLVSTFSEESYETFREAVIAIAEGKVRFESEATTATLTGKLNRIHLRLHVLPGSEQTYKEVLISVVDITEHKRAEEALQTQARILESMAEGVIVIDEHGTVIYANPAFHDILGILPGELIGQNVAKINAGSVEEQEKVAKGIMGEILETGRWHGEVRNRKKDGTTLLSYARCSSLEINGKKYMISVQEDITERKQVEDALRESEASYRIVTEGSLAGVYLIQDGLFRYVNPVLAQAFGYAPDEVIDHLGPLDLVHPDDRPRIAKNIQQRLTAQRQGARNHFKGIRKDGSIIFCEMLTRQVEYQGCPAIMGTLLDITERRRAEEALKASEAKYHTIFDAVNDAIAVLEPETGNFLEFNRKIREMSGLDPAEASDWNLADICSPRPPFTIREAREWMGKAVEEGPQLFEWSGKDRRGRRFWIEVSLIFTPLGGRNLLLAVGRDISERKQVEDIRRQAYAELERLVAVRTAGLEWVNTQLRQQIEERRRTEAIIRLQRDLALALSGKVSLEATLRLCVETGISFSGLDSGGVYLVDPVTGSLSLTYHQGFSPKFVESVSHYEADSVNAYLVTVGKPLYARLQDLPGILDAAGLEEGLGSAAIIPVIHQDRVIASINIASHQYEEVPETAQAALETLAAQVGSAIARVQAEEELRRAKEDLEIRVAERTVQLKQANESLEQELKVRRQIEQALRHSEAKYRTLVEQIPAITYIISLTGGVELIYVSPQIESLLGFSPAEWRADSQKTWMKQIHAEDRERVLAEITRSVESDRPFSTEYRLLAKSGRIVWFRDEARVIYDRDGQPLFLQGLALDITERKLAENALKETTHTLQTLIEASPLAIITLDRDFRIKLWNPGAERMFGWKEAEVLGKPLPVVPENQQAEEGGRLEQEMAGKAQSALELTRVRKDGSLLDVHLWTASLLDANGKIIGNMGILADITARKRAEEALKASEANYRAIFNGVNDGIAVVDMNTGDFLDVNQKWLELTGFRAEEAIGLNVAALCLPGSNFTPEVAYHLIQDTIRKGPQLFEWQATTKDGRPHWVEVNLKRTVINNQDRILTVVRDISERKRVEEELRRQAELLDLAHDAILVRDLDNRIVFWNSGAEETYGWRRDEALGQEAHGLLHTEFPEALEAMQNELFRQGQWQGELTHNRKDGWTIVVASRWALQRDKDGRPMAILEINRDITQRKQAEAGRARLAAILEATSDLVGTADLKGRLLYLNRAGRHMVGLGADDDISHLTVKDLQPEWADRLLLEHGCVEAIRHEVWSGETAFLGPDGREIPTSQVLIAHKNAENEVEFFSTVARDITESKRAAEALQEVNNRLRTLVEACPLAIIARNLAGQIISWNPAAERMFGWTRDEVIGGSLPTIPPGEEEASEILDQSKMEGETKLGLELRRQRRDGSLIDVSLSSAPLQDGAGHMTGTMGIIEDITERKRMEETLRKVSRALKAITECHQALIRATNEAELLNEVCRIIVEVGGYRMAWVGYAESDAAKSIRPVAQEGFADGYVEKLQLTWANQSRGRGPVGKAIRRGKPVICRDTCVDRDLAFIREEARKRGYASILALPLRDTRTFGSLAIYAVDPDAFDQEEIDLLMGLSNDLAFGIAALRARQERQRAEAALKATGQELRLLASRLLSFQEQERRRVARELHDELGQALTVLKIHLVAIEEQLSADQQPLKAGCEQMLSYIDTVIENVRRLAWDLSPSSLEDLGLSSSLGYLVDEICRNHNMQSSVVMDEIDNLFPPETKINIYRIFQESLTNIVKHARASRVEVDVHHVDGKVSFMIHDDGRGFDLSRALSRKSAKRSLGLTAMNERALMAQGSLQIASQKGYGTTITFTIPTDKHGK